MLSEASYDPLALSSFNSESLWAGVRGASPEPGLGACTVSFRQTRSAATVVSFTMSNYDCLPQPGLGRLADGER
jgi:hypothetical protein